MGCRVWSVRCTVWGLGCRVWGLGFGVWGLHSALDGGLQLASKNVIDGGVAYGGQEGFRFRVRGFRVWGLGFRGLGFGV